MKAPTTRLVGVHSVNKTLADGSVTTYHYAWRGGPRIEFKLGTHAFVQEFARLTKERAKKESEAETIGSLMDQYLKAGDGYGTVKAVSSRRDYERSFGKIRQKFSTFPLAALEARGVRKMFTDWRDTMRETPRAADLHLAVLARIFSWGKDKELILRHPLEEITKLHDGGNRKDAIWMPSQLKTFFADGHPHLVEVVKMALWTMQRQADILTMETKAYDDGRLWIIQGKTKARVRVRPADELLPILADAKAKGRKHVLVNSFGDNWTSSGFRSSFGKECARLKIEDVRFHDLRGTGISYAYAHGMDVDRIAEISGHSKADCEAIIRRHYLAGSDVIEAIKKGTQP
jgi:integrase